jgi:UPF0716 family protein affecting phage T7 exclusion
MDFSIEDDLQVNLFNSILRALIVGAFSILSPGFITYPIAILLIVFYLKNKNRIDST